MARRKYPSAYSPIVGGTPFDNVDWSQVASDIAAGADREAEAADEADDQYYFEMMRKRVDSMMRQHGVGKYKKTKLSELDQLYRRVEAQKAQAARVDVNENAAKQPSLLQRVFDVLSRGQYASASASMNELKATQSGKAVQSRVQLPGLLGMLDPKGMPVRDVVGSAQAAWQGLMGRSKLSYEDVLEQGPLPKSLDKESKSIPALRATLGFAGDVALDPTTYIGGGAVKKVGKEAIEQAGILAVKKAYKSPEIIKQGRNAVSLATKSNRGRALPRAEQIRVHNEAVADSLSLISKKAREEAAEQGAGRIAFKVLGQEVGTSSGIGRQFGETTYKGLSAVGRAIGETTPAQAVGRAFSTRASAPGALHTIQRVFHGRGVSEIQQGLKQWRQITGTISKKDSETITKALQEGTDIDGLLDESGKTDLGEIASTARAMFDDMFKHESVMGYYKPTQYGDKYVPRYARKGLEKNKKKWHDATDVPFEQAKDLFNVTPVTDVRELVARRTAQYFRRKAQYQLVKELEMEYGLKVVGKKSVKTGVDKATAKKLGLKTIPHVTADGKTYVPSTVHDFVEEMKKLSGDPEYAKDLLNIYDKNLNRWKSLVTVVNPGFHVRNTIGDVFLNWMAGVKSPVPYGKAVKVLAGTAAPEGKAGKAVQALTPSGLKPKQGQTISIGGNAVNVDDVKYLYHQAGLNVGFFREELGKAGKGLETIRKASEARENWARMTNFIDSMEKIAYAKNIKFTGKNAREKLAKVAIEAGKRVRKFNIDYGDLTPFEKNVGKRVLPFYTWMRKSTPLLLESLFFEPGKFAKIPKAKRAIESILGTDEDQDEKVEDMIPKWILDYSALRIKGGDEPEFVGASNLLPIQMLGEFTEPADAIKYIAGSATPALQIPGELALGREFFTGRERREGSQYALSKAGGAFNLLGKGTSEHGLAGRDAINYITGAGYQDTPDYRKQGELYRQDEILRKLLKKKKDQLQGQLGMSQ